jgi:hypothetical protein
MHDVYVRETVNNEKQECNIHVSMCLYVCACTCVCAHMRVLCVLYAFTVLVFDNVCFDTRVHVCSYMFVIALAFVFLWVVLSKFTCFILAHAQTTCMHEGIMCVNTPTRVYTSTHACMCTQVNK